MQNVLVVLFGCLVKIKALFFCLLLEIYILLNKVKAHFIKKKELQQEEKKRILVLKSFDFV